MRKWGDEEKETVPCGLCGSPTTKKSTKRCDRCWELETRIKGDKELAVKIMRSLGFTFMVNSETLMWLIPNIKLNDEEKEMLVEIIRSDGIEAHRAHWHIADSLAAKGIVRVGPSRGPEKAWRRVVLKK